MTCRATMFLSLFLCLSNFGYSQAAPVEVKVRTLSDQPLPVRIVSGILRNFEYTSQLDVSLAEETAKPLESAQFYLVVIRKGKVVAGDGWMEKTPSDHFFRQTNIALQDGDEAILLINEVTVNARSFKLSQADVAEAIQHIIRQDAAVISRVEMSLFKWPGLKRADWGDESPECMADLQAAVATCGSGKVASFSCDPRTEAWSFTCKP